MRTGPEHREDDRKEAGILIPPSGALLAQQGRPLAEYVPLFLQWFTFVRQRSMNTVLSYGENLKRFLAFCARAGLARPEDVNFRHIEFYLGWLQQEHGLKPRSANHRVHCLRSFWRWMVREGITTRNPATEVPAPGDQAPPAIFARPQSGAVALAAC